MEPQPSICLSQIMNLKAVYRMFIATCEYYVQYAQTVTQSHVMNNWVASCFYCMCSNEALGKNIAHNYSALTIDTTFAVVPVAVAYLYLYTCFLVCLPDLPSEMYHRRSQYRRKGN